MHLFCGMQDFNLSFSVVTPDHLNSNTIVVAPTD
jgi:hypothetical protein